MAAIHNLRRRIKSVRNTRQITRAMKLVAAAKMKRAQERVYHARPYANKLQDVIRSVGSRLEIGKHPLLLNRPETNIRLVVVSADRGLCGSFNAVVFRRVFELLEQWQDKNIVVDFIGRKGFEHFQNKVDTVGRNYKDVFRKFDPTVGAGIAADLMNDFVAGECDAVYVVYNEFKSVLQQNLIVERLLPLVEQDFSGKEALIPHLFEPSAEEVLHDLLPRYVETQIFRVLIESNAAEFAARMTAMEAATKNATEMIDKLTLQMNKIRQAAITTEIIEVVSGGQISN
ncbi:MAG: ATP synthase F1 subunit gamma [Acidobacteria bacterium]|nr:MAG: ATP synthase F1 subunit gamma [Acidobacteriota bacterium]RLE21882.1 MAG: ATP synthase F1 subunit gamma [Acidobacteriota bacterium]